MNHESLKKIKLSRSILLHAIKMYESRDFIKDFKTLYIHDMHCVN